MPDYLAGWGLNTGVQGPWGGRSDLLDDRPPQDRRFQPHRPGPASNLCNPALSPLLNLRAGNHLPC
jgi:hypothetical protein